MQELTKYSKSMNVTTSKKFQERIEAFFEYCQLNYGMTVTQKKRDEYNKILDRILMFPESSRVEPLLVGKKKVYRAVNFEKDIKYTPSAKMKSGSKICGIQKWVRSR